MKMRNIEKAIVRKMQLTSAYACVCVEKKERKLMIESMLVNCSRANVIRAVNTKYQELYSSDFVNKSKTLAQLVGTSNTCEIGSLPLDASENVAVTLRVPVASAAPTLNDTLNVPLAALSGARMETPNADTVDVQLRLCA